jgi:chromate transporter
MTHADALDLFLRFAALSLLAVGGALGTAPEMRRFLVDERHWISGVQFTDSIAIAQAAPGPNILFVTLLGWQAGGALGAFAATAGLMLPSSVVTWSAWRWKRASEDAPLVAGWVVAAGSNHDDLRMWALTLVTAVIVATTRLNMLWLIGAGALLGALGWVG